MPRFHIQSHRRLIGYSELEFGDPPMGVAHGQFLPSPEYAEVQSQIVGSYGDQGHLELAVFSEDQCLIPCQAVAINDQSAEFGPEGLYIELLGIPYPEYESIFPQHVADYEK